MQKDNKKWVHTFSIEEDGFHGHLYRPVKDEYPGTILLVLGGGGMPYKLTMDEAAAFADLGVSALAVGYFGVRSAPKTIVRVPIEYLENAANYLHENGFVHVIAAGISKGAELSLAAASCIPELNGVIAFSPSSRIYMGIGPGISWVNYSSWTFRGKDLPYAYAHASGWHTLVYSLKAQEPTFRPVYERAARESGEESVIPVEKICGPILVCGSSSDSLWPGGEACRDIIRRLDMNRFPFPHKQLIYPYASHLLLPFVTGYEKLFRIGRKYPEECFETAQDLQNEILVWLRDAVN